MTDILPGRASLLILPLLTLVVGVQQLRAEGDWPGWRGPGGVGVRTEAFPGLHWSATSGVQWKVAVPGEGHASPVVVGDRVLVSTAQEQAQTRSLLCYHSKTGALLWNTEMYRGGFLPKHDKNSHASATPACDGQRVYVPFLAQDGLWLYAVTREGQIAWQVRLGPFVSQYGYASCPVVHGNLVIVVGDNQGTAGDSEETSSYLVGVARETGQVIWRVPRPLAPSYGTPVVARLAGRDQLLLCGAGRITAYEPASGKELWFYRWSAHRSANSVVASADCVFASTSWPEAQIVCVRADGSGDVTSSHLVWQQRRGATDVPSPIYHEGHLYVVNDKGMASCLDGASGAVLWQARLGSNVSASPVLAGTCILAPDETGITHLFQAAGTHKALARNSLNDPILASPALSGSQVFLRSRHYLWCLEPQREPPAVASNPPSVRPRQPELKPSVPSLGQGRQPKAAADQSSFGADWLDLVLMGLIGGCLLLSGVFLWLILQGRRTARTALPQPREQEQQGQPGPGQAITFRCAGCKQRLRVSSALAEKKVRCPRCEEPVRVPGP